MKLKVNIKAPNFKLPSTDDTIFELNKVKKKILFYIFIQKMILQVVLLNQKILAN
jgi:peroxiredoxin